MLCQRFLSSANFVLGHISPLYLYLALGLAWLLYSFFNSKQVLNLPSHLDVLTVPCFSSLFSLRHGHLKLQLRPSPCEDFLRLWVFLDSHLSQVSRAPTWHGTSNKPARHMHSYTDLLSFPCLSLLSKNRLLGQWSCLGQLPILTSGTLRWPWMGVPAPAVNFRARSSGASPGLLVPTSDN